MGKYRIQIESKDAEGVTVSGIDLDEVDLEGKNFVIRLIDLDSSVHIELKVRME